LRLFNTLTTFGTPQDVMLQEMRIEMLFPADGSSDAILQEWETHASVPASNDSANWKTNVPSKRVP
jgi:hypothetical protein